MSKPVIVVGQTIISELMQGREVILEAATLIPSSELMNNAKAPKVPGYRVSLSCLCKTQKGHSDIHFMSEKIRVLKKGTRKTRCGRAVSVDNIAWVADDWKRVTCTECLKYEQVN